MANLPQIVETCRLAAEIPVRAYLRDHAFGGKAVLPAVEALQVIADTVFRWRPGTDLDHMQGLAFDKFLSLQSSAAKIDAQVAVARYNNEDIAAELLTKSRTGRTSIKRTLSHARLIFPSTPPQVQQYPFPDANRLSGEPTAIDPERLYNELVPFGPAYRNITGDLRISREGAVARIRAPQSPDAADVPWSLGSPFVLDAAFHAACVWGQRFSGFVAFPVGLEELVISDRPRPGATYTGRINPAQILADLLKFDLWIYDDTGRTIVSARGVRMRDVSGGRIKPPQWILEGGK